MSTNTTLIVKTLGLVVLNVVLTACSGGGGYSSGTSGNTYTGKTTVAAITPANGQSIATKAFQGGNTGVVAPASARSDPGATHIDLPRIPALEKILNSTLEKIHPIPENRNYLQAAVVSGSNILIPGTCSSNPGNASFNFSYDDNTHDLNGSLTLNQYCEKGETLSGNMSISGSYNAAKGDFDTVSVTMTDLLATTAHDSFTVISGTMTFDFTQTPTVITMNMLFRDNGASVVYRFENVILTDATDAFNNEDFTLSGRFFDPSEGYVDLSTLVPLHVNSGDNWPSSGQIKVTGQNNSSAILTVLSNTTYKVDVDQDNDGSIDSTTTGNWADL